MKKLVQVLGIAVAGSYLTGCFSIGQRVTDDGCPNGFYAGTERAYGLGQYFIFPYVDLPFSAALDTVLLPVDAICQAARKS
jgi:uncharacterized protein YceK